MKKWPIVFTVIILALGLGFFLSNKRAKTVAPESPKAAQDAAVINTLANQDTNTVAIIQSNFARVQTPTAPSTTPAIPQIPAGQPAPLQFTNFDPQIVLEDMARAVRQYGTMFGGNPVGSNPEIASQLSGNNPKHINFLDASQGMRVNEKGELVDSWGTPYFFHQLSATDMEIHSAGPDRNMWTADDLVTH